MEEGGERSKLGRGGRGGSLKTKSQRHCAEKKQKNFQCHIHVRHVK